MRRHVMDPVATGHWLWMIVCRKAPGGFWTFVPSTGKFTDRERSEVITSVERMAYTLRWQQAQPQQVEVSDNETVTDTVGKRKLRKLKQRGFKRSVSMLTRVSSQPSELAQPARMRKSRGHAPFKILYNVSFMSLLFGLSRVQLAEQVFPKQLPLDFQACILVSLRFNSDFNDACWCLLVPETMSSSTVERRLWIFSLRHHQVS